MQIHWRLAKNALANLGRGSAAAVAALLLPPVLVRHMTPASYGVWVIALQTAAYMGFVDFGLQTAVGRYIAFSNEKKDTVWRDAIFSTALAGLSIAALLGFVVIVGIAIASHQIFPEIPAPLLPSLRLTIFIVGVSAALGLPASTSSGVFVGLQRNEIPALAIGTGKLFSAIGLILAAIMRRSLVCMAVIVASANLYSYALQIGLMRRIAPEIRFRKILITPAVIRELLGYCSSMTIWQFSSFLVSGLDLILVGRFQFNEVTPYAVSATLITFLGGLQVAVFGVIMPHAAELHARQRSEELGSLLVKTTRLGLLMLLLTGLPLIVFAAPIIRIWIGAQFARAGGDLLAILVIANMVRLVGIPYASILMGTGQQKLVIVSPVMEGVTNLLASVLLGLKFGAAGVAWGTLIGAFVGMFAHVLYNFPRTKACICVSQWKFVKIGILEPSTAAIPICLAAIYAEWKGMEVTVPLAIAFALSMCVSFSLVIKSVPQFRKV